MPRLGTFLAYLGDRCLSLAELVDPLDLPPMDSGRFLRRVIDTPPPPALHVPTVFLDPVAFYSLFWREHV